MDNDRLSVYLRSIEEDYPDYLEQIEKEALRNRIPIIRRETASFLCTLIAMKKPANILEIGTAVGYSAEVMAYASDYLAKITTIELKPENIKSAKENFAMAAEAIAKAGGKIPDIKLLCGDATDILPGLTGTYDFIFMDAAKGQYPAWLSEVLRLLDAGGILVTDNVLQEGTVLESRFAVTRRDRTIHARMREYLWRLKHTAGLKTSILNVGDGVAITLKTEGEIHEET